MCSSDLGGDGHVAQAQAALVELDVFLDQVDGRQFGVGHTHWCSKTQVQMTRLGQTMLPTFRQIFDHAMQAREQARRHVSGHAEQVRVGVMCTIEFPQQLLPGFNQSQSGRSQVSLSFHEGNLESLTDSLDRGDVDLCVMCSPWDIPKRFVVTPLYREDYVVAFGDDHRFNGRQAVALAELNRERNCERTQFEFTVYIERLLTARGVNLEVVQQSAREDSRPWCGPTSASRS